MKENIALCRLQLECIAAYNLCCRISFYLSISFLHSPCNLNGRNSHLKDTSVFQKRACSFDTDKVANFYGVLSVLMLKNRSSKKIT